MANDTKSISNSKTDTLINGTDGNDYIYNSAKYVTINGGDGNDTIVNHYSNDDNMYVSINGGTGNDYIDNTAFYTTIDAGAGKDTIYNWIGSYGQTIWGGDGDDSIYSEYRTTLDAGKGNDNIYAIAGSISGGEGNDRIHLEGRYLGVTVNAGKGDDYMEPNNNSPYYYGRLYLYKNGDGNDTITSVEAIDTVQVGDGTAYSTVATGTDEKDLLIKVGNGSILVKNGVGVNFTLTNATIASDEFIPVPINIVNENADSIVTGTDLDDTIENRGAGSSISGGDGVDVITNWAEKSVLDGNDGDDIIQNEASNSTVYGGDGADVLYNMQGTESKEVVFNGGRGNDVINNFAEASTLIGGEGDDTIYNYADNAAIDAGAGNDLVYNYGKNSVVEGGEDADRIYNRAEGAIVNGNDGDDYIYNAGANSELNGGDGNDTIENYGENVTINGGEGNDVITLAGGNEVLKYGKGEGNDTIYGFGFNNALLIDADYTTQKSGENAIISIEGGGHIVLENIGSYDLIADSVTGALLIDTTPPEAIPEDNTDADGYQNEPYEYEVKKANTHVNVANLTYNDFDIDSDGAPSDISGTRFVLSNPEGYSKVTLTGGDGNDTYEGNENVGEVFNFNVKNEIGNDVIEGFGLNDTLKLEKGTFSSAYVNGDDYVVIVKYGKNTGSITIKDGALMANNLQWNSNHTAMEFDGEVKLSNSKSNVTVTGTSNRDYIVNTGNKVVIDGKRGDDTIIASDNAERFVVSPINGNDVIDGFSAGDTLSASGGTITSYESDGENLIVTVDDGSNSAKITLLDAADLKVNNKGTYLTVDSVNYNVNRDDNIKVEGTSGRDYILNGGSGVSIQSGAGDDTIEGSNLGEVILFATGYGNDVVKNFGKNDTLKVTSGTVKSQKAVGDDFVVSLKGGSTITLLGMGSSKFIYDKTAKTWTVNAPNEITNATDSIKVSGTDGKDFIVNTGENVTIQSGGGNDTITGSDEYGEVFAFGSTDDNNVITNFGPKDTFRAVEGTISGVDTVENDLIVSIQGSTATSIITLQGAAGGTIKQSGNVITSVEINRVINHTDNVTVGGTTGQDYIVNNGENVTIKAGGDNDTIVGSDYSEQFQFSYASGDDVITNFGKGDTLKTTSGNITSVETVDNDVVVTIKQSGKKAVGTITLQGAAALNLKYDKTNLWVEEIKYIEVKEANKKTSGEGIDYITNPHAYEGVSIQAGGGDDTIEGSEAKEVFMMSYASGDDVITNFGEGDTLAATSADTVSTIQSGNDLIVSMHKKDKTAVGTVTLKDVDITQLKKVGKNIVAASGITIDNTTPNIAVEGTDYDDVIGNVADNVTIRAGAGNDTMSGSDYGETYEFNAIDGNDVIQDFGMGDIVRVALGEVNLAKKSGDDYIIEVVQGDNVGRLTLEGAGDKVIKNGKIFMGGGTVTLRNSKNDAAIPGTAFDDYIVNSGNNAVINGKGGNDTIIASDNAEVIQFASDGGQDLVQSFGTNDTLQIVGGAISSRRQVGLDYVVEVRSNLYNGTITLEGAGGYNFVESSDNNGQYLTVEEIKYLNNDKDNTKITGTSGKEKIYNTGANVTIATGKGNDTVEGSNFGEMFLTATGQGDDVILNFGLNDTLKVTSGTVKSQKADGDDFLVSLKGGSTMRLIGMGSTKFNYDKTNKTWTVNTVNSSYNDKDSIKVGGTGAFSGKDFITNTGEGVTIQAGGANDTITGSDDYGELVLMSYASGDDVMTNFGKGDTIKSTSGTMTYEVVDDDVLVTVTKGKNSGTTLLKGAASLNLKLSGNALTPVTVNEITNFRDDYKVSGSTDADYIVNTGENVTIQAGGDNDTIDGSIFGEVFQFSYASGNDVITNFGIGDTLQNTSGTMKYAVDGDDVVVTITKGKNSGHITLQGAAGYNFSTDKNNKKLFIDAWNEIINTTDNVTVSGSDKADYIANTGSNVTIRAGGGNDIITGADSFSEKFLFSYASGKDTITNFGIGDTLMSTSGTVSYKQSGNDYIVSIKKSGKKTVGTIVLQDVADTITLDKSDNNYIASPKRNSSSTSAKLLAPAEDDYWFINDDTATETKDNEVTAMMTELDSDNSIGKLDYSSDPSELLMSVDGDSKLEKSLALNARHRARK